MVSRYNLFRLKLILEETKVEYRSNFESILRMMLSPVAKFLLEVQNRDIDIDINNIGSGEGDDMVNFTSPKRTESKIVWKVQGSYCPIIKDPKILARFNIPTSTYSHGQYYVGSDTKDNLFTIEDELSPDEVNKLLSGNITDKILKIKSVSNAIEYAIINGPLSNYIEKTNDVFPKSRDQEIKVGRFVNKILGVVGEKFSSKQIEEFVNEFKSKVILSKDSFRNFEVVEGDRIAFYYDGDNYDKSKASTLHSSCMRYKECQNYFDIYTKNPEVCKLLILKSDEDQSKIVARALVWTTISGNIFMDRIYFSKESDPNLFIEYAEKMGWFYKVSGMIGKSKPKFEKMPSKSDVQLKIWKVEYYPFLDTLMYLGVTTGILTETKQNNTGLLLQDTGGAHLEECDTCDGEGNVECSHCDGNGSSECEECGGDGTIKCICKNGRITCTGCEGSGKVGEEDCEDCEGEGEVDCSDCGGDGKIECGECSGDGKIECEECYGEGQYNCPECN